MDSPSEAAFAAPPLVKAATWLNHLEFDRRSPVSRHWVEDLFRVRVPTLVLHCRRDASVRRGTPGGRGHPVEPFVALEGLDPVAEA